MTGRILAALFCFAMAGLMIWAVVDYDPATSRTTGEPYLLISIAFVTVLVGLGYVMGGIEERRR